MSDQCLSCGAKGHRNCPTLAGMICSVCCGSKRGSEIICHAECPVFPFGANSYDLWLRMDGPWMKKALRYVVQHIGPDQFQQMTKKNAIGDFENDEYAFSTSNELVTYLVLFVHPFQNGQPLVDRWEKEGFAGLNNDERMMMRYRRKSFATVIEIQKVVNSQATECLDLFEPDPKPFILYDRNTAAKMTRFERILTWACHYPHFSRIGPSGMQVPHHLSREFIEEIRDKAAAEGAENPKEYLKLHFPEACRLLTQVHERKFSQMVRSVDSHHCIAKYDLTANREHVEAVLLDKPDFEPDKPRDDEKADPPGTQYYTWLRKGESKKFEKKLPEFMRHKTKEDGVGILGRVKLLPKSLILETFGQEKFRFAKKMIDKYFGQKVFFDNETVVNLAKKAAENVQARWAAGESEETMPPERESGIPLEAEREMLEKFYQRHYEKLMNEPVPMLDNMTPKKAAKKPEMREKLLEFMKLHLNGLEKMNREKNINISIDWMVKELGLKELA